MCHKYKVSDRDECNINRNWKPSSCGTQRIGSFPCYGKSVGSVVVKTFTTDHILITYQHRWWRPSEGWREGGLKNSISELKVQPVVHSVREQSIMTAAVQYPLFDKGLFIPQAVWTEDRASLYKWTQSHLHFFTTLPSTSHWWPVTNSLMKVVLYCSCFTIWRP